MRTFIIRKPIESYDIFLERCQSIYISIPETGRIARSFLYKSSIGLECGKKLKVVRVL